MGKYLYIPTTTRNLNNILISRSISPAHFYPKKGFGVPRFHLVDLNDNEHITYCYSDKLEFSIINTDYEEDPIIIIIPLSYIDTCASDSKQIAGTAVHRVYDTIELKDLRECGVGFFSEDARKRCEVNAEKALEIKGFHYIKDILKLTSHEQKSISVSDFSYKVDDPTNNINEEESLRTERLNEKIKGANFCYILSLASNYKSVCWISPELPKKYQQINQLLNSREVLQRTEDGGTEVSEAFKSIAKLLEPDNTLLDVIIQRISEIDIVFNNDNFKAKKIELLLDIGKKISAITPDWQSSPQRGYINSFGQNLTEYTEFDINKTNSAVLKSLVFVLQSGRDLDKMDRELKGQSIEVHGISFLIWGMFFGYCNIPKTVYDPVFDERKPVGNLQVTIPSTLEEPDSPEVPPVCEDCNTPMNKKFRNDTGQAFWGCINWRKGKYSCSKTQPFKHNINITSTTLDSKNLLPVIIDIKNNGCIAVVDLKKNHKSIFGKMPVAEISKKIMQIEKRVQEKKDGRKRYLEYLD